MEGEYNDLDREDNEEIDECLAGRVDPIELVVDRRGVIVSEEAYKEVDNSVDYGDQQVERQHAPVQRDLVAWVLNHHRHKREGV